MPIRSLEHDGKEWTVWDTHPATSAGASGGHPAVAESHREGWLTFQCDSEKRRLVPVPPAWSELSEQQLASLLERAMPVRRAPDMRF